MNGRENLEIRSEHADDHSVGHEGYEGFSKRGAEELVRIFV